MKQEMSHKLPEKKGETVPELWDPILDPETETGRMCRVIDATFSGRQSAPIGRPSPVDHVARRSGFAEGSAP